MRLRAFCSAQAAWAVARIIHDTLFRITIIFNCRLYIMKTIKEFGLTLKILEQLIKMELHLYRRRKIFRVKGSR